MNLTFNELRKRDVVNVVDGRCLGRIVDIDLSFPKGIFIGIIVPGRKSNIFTRIFDCNKLYIPESNIIKIGGDVILVNVKCGETCLESTKVSPPTKNACPPRFETNCQPSPKHPPKPHGISGEEQSIFSGLGDDYE